MLLFLGNWQIIFLLNVTSSDCENESKQYGGYYEKNYAYCCNRNTLVLSTSVMAGSDGVEHAMKMMNKSYRAALKEEDVTSFRKDMQDLKSTAESILNGPVEGYDRETYVAGMSLLIDEVTAVESTAEKEGLDAGKIAAQKLGSMMRKYHNKLGVD
jgi:soluble cytochrome b562